jgi:hypothetical protein
VHYFDDESGAAPKVAVNMVKMRGKPQNARSESGHGAGLEVKKKEKPRRLSPRRFFNFLIEWLCYGELFACKGAVFVFRATSKAASSMASFGTEAELPSMGFAT